MTNEERAKLVEQLRDEDSYYRIQESHWCIDSEELERQRQQAADQIEADGKRIAELEAKLLDYWSDWNAKGDRIAELEAALGSIARNTCCGQCQEAALVARAALGETK